jgi:hypothetical protein
MSTNRLAAVALAVVALAAPLDALAWVVVRAAPVYYAPRPVVVVAPMPVYVAPAPVYVAPAPVYVAPPPQGQSILTTRLPIGTNLGTLPPGCNGMTVNGGFYYQCGVNWMRPLEGPNGSYFSVVPPP